jgi:hypothetical protein
MRDEMRTIRHLLTASVAALSVLYASAAHAEGWEIDCRRDRIYKEFPKPDAHGLPNVWTSEREDGSTFAAIDRKEFDEIAKAIAEARREFKKCDRFWQCVADRDAGKVKHCYENDRRWR